MDDLTGNDLIDIDPGGGDPADDDPGSGSGNPPTERELLQSIAANQAQATAAIEALAEQQGADPNTTSVYPFTLRAAVPPLTSEVDPIEASFETPAAGTLTIAIPRFPKGVQDTTGVALFGPSNDRLLPRGGEYNFDDGSGGRETGDVKFLTGNDTTYPPIELNVRCQPQQSISAEFANSDPNEQHLVSIDCYYREDST